MADWCEIPLSRPWYIDGIWYDHKVMSESWSPLSFECLLSRSIRHHGNVWDGFGPAEFQISLEGFPAESMSLSILDLLHSFWQCVLTEWTAWSLKLKLSKRLLSFWNRCNYSSGKRFIPVTSVHTKPCITKKAYVTLRTYWKIWLDSVYMDWKETKNGISSQKSVYIWTLSRPTSESLPIGE